MEEGKVREVLISSVPLVNDSVTDSSYAGPSGDVNSYLDFLDHATEKLKKRLSKKSASNCEQQAHCPDIVEEIKIEPVIIEEIKTEIDDPAVADTEEPVLQSVKSYLQDGTFTTEMCRICLRAIVGTPMIKLQQDSSGRSQKLRAILTLILPELDLELYPNSVVCLRCSNLLAFSAELKDIYKTAEEKLNKVISDSKKYKVKSADLAILTTETTKNDPEDCFKFIFTADAETNNVMIKSQFSSNTGSILRNILSGVSTKVNDKEINCATCDISKDDIDERLISTKPDCYGSGPFLCQICGFQTTKKPCFKSHLYQHKKIPKDMTCEHCGAVFDSHVKFQSHRKLHSKKPKTFQCDACHKIFKHRYILRRHINHVHLKKFNFSQCCHVCGKKFSDRMYLYAHMVTHNTDSRKHSCKICGKRFLTPFKLKGHMERHNTDGDKFKCEFCHREIKYKATFKQHIKIYHSDGWELTCEVCKRPYWKKRDLDKHRLLMHQI